MAFSFRDENEVQGANSFYDDPLSPNGIPARQIGVWGENQGPIDAAQAVSRAVFIAPYQCMVVGVKVIFKTAGGAGATVTVEKLTGTTAPGSGTALLTAPLAINGTANTLASGTLITNQSSLTLNAGDCIGLVFAGTQTGLVGLVVNILLQKI